MNKLVVELLVVATLIGIGFYAVAHIPKPSGVLVVVQKHHRTASK